MTFYLETCLNFIFLKANRSSEMKQTVSVKPKQFFFPSVLGQPEMNYYFFGSDSKLENQLFTQFKSQPSNLHTNVFSFKMQQHLSLFLYLLPVLYKYYSNGPDYNFIMAIS